MSAKLMFRSGMIRKLASGVYEWLPAGLRVRQKVENIIRQELNKVGGIEVSLPVIQPKELWEATGRWNVYGKELLKIKDRKEAEFCFAPTAEEVITNMVRRDVKSYRQLPLFLYQIGLKFRDEIRPRFGVMRSREFIMKDGYSFHATEEDAEKRYAEYYEAYSRIFERCGLKFKPVEAESGPIGGNHSHEFMVLADTGEAEIALCDSCGYAANTEKAGVYEPPERKADPAKMEAVKEISTPGLHTVEEVAEFLHIKTERFIKTYFIMDGDEPVMLLVRGDHEVCENKVKHLLGIEQFEKAPVEIYETVAGCPPGFAGPVGIRERYRAVPGTRPLKKIIADLALKNVFNAVTGGNKADTHISGVNTGRDYEPDVFADIHTAAPGDLCPKCGAPLTFRRGIEVGHTFKLGVKYSKTLNCNFLDDKQQEKPMTMGCYGIGVTRTVAAAIEQSHDENGIIWPPEIAPFEFSLITLGEDDNILAAAETVEKEIYAAGMDVLRDDRNERPGVKFKDADLIGLPWRLVISQKTVKDGECEFKRRGSKTAERWKLSETAEKIKALKKEIR